MAQGVDPLRRDAIRQVAQDTGDRFTIGTSNRALDLARSLGDLVPGVRELAFGIGQQLQERAQSNAKRDAIVANGARLADAVREGRIRPTQNPWYMQAYRSESAAIRGGTALRTLQVESASWPERNDPAAFQARWNREVAAISQGEPTDQDTSRGFVAAVNQVTPQVLQANTAQNVQRIEQERRQNVSALAAQAIADLARQSGGAPSPNAVYAALAPARDRWFATGGSLDDWNQLALQALTTAAYSTQNPDLVDLARAPELINGPSEAGATPMAPAAARPDALVPAEAGQVQPGQVAAPGAIAPPPAGEAPAFAPGAALTLDQAHSERGSQNGRRSAQPPAPPEFPPHSAGEVPGRSYLPVHGPITGSYGERRRRQDGSPRGHGGTDIAVPVGTPVRAPEVEGVVRRVGRSGNYGLRAEIEYAGGITVTVAHLSSTELQPGQSVPGGAVLGRSGGRRGDPNAGNATGPHVHYEVRRDGVLVDPRTVNFASHGGAQARAEAPGTEGQPGAAGVGSGGDPAPGGQGQPAAGAVPVAPPVADIVSRGPSLYDIAGAAADLESARYRIQSATLSGARNRLEAIRAQRQLNGVNLAGQLWQRFGNALTLGTVTREQMVAALPGADPQDIAAAISEVRNAVQDSAGLSEAQLRARGANPQEAQQILDLATEGRQNGFTPEWKARVDRLVGEGRISSDTALGMISAAQATSDRNASEARTDARQRGAEDRAASSAYRAQIRTQRFADVNALATRLAQRVVARGAQLGARPAGDREQYQLSMEGTIRDAMMRYLETHEDDFSGALNAGQRVAAAAIAAIVARQGGARPSQSGTATQNSRR